MLGVCWNSRHGKALESRNNAGRQSLFRFSSYGLLRAVGMVPAGAMILSLKEEFAMSVCFFCSNPINRLAQRHMRAGITHHFKHGGVRTSERDFHLSCYDKFRAVGRPYNPETAYSVDWATVMIGDEELREETDQL